MCCIDKYFKRIILLTYLMMGFYSYAQDRDKSKLKFKSWSVTPELYEFSNRNSEMFSGILPLSLSIDFTYALSNNLFSFSASYGGETGVFSGSANYKQMSLLYGREFVLEDWFLVETHLGGGMFFYGSSDLEGNISEFAVPLVGKVRFKTGERFSIGLRFTYIFNSFSNLYSGGLLLQWDY